MGLIRTPSTPETAGRRRGVPGVLKVILAASALGTLGPVAGLAYQAGVQPTEFSALRAAIGAAVLGLLVVFGGGASVRLRSLPRRQRVMLLAAVTVNGVMNLLLFVAFGAMAVAVVMVIFFTYPVLTALLAVALRRERLTGRRMAALSLTILGLALVLGGRLGPDTNLTVPGLILAAGAAVCHALYLIVIRDGFPLVPPVQATALVLGGGVVVSGTAALMTAGTHLIGPWIASPTAWAAIVFAGTIGAALPKVWVIGGVRLIGSTRAAVLMLLEPVTAVVVAAIVLAQRPSAPELAGGVAVLAAVIVVRRRDPAAELVRVSVGVDPGGAANRTAS